LSAIAHQQKPQQPLDLTLPSCAAGFADFGAGAAAKSADWISPVAGAAACATSGLVALAAAAAPESGAVAPFAAAGDSSGLRSYAPKRSHSTA